MANDLAQVHAAIDAHFRDKLANSAVSRDTAIWNFMQDFRESLKKRVAEIFEPAKG